MACKIIVNSIQFDIGVGSTKMVVVVVVVVVCVCVWGGGMDTSLVAVGMGLKVLAVCGSLGVLGSCSSRILSDAF